MNKEEIEYVTEIILDRIMTSDLSNYSKIELLINMRTFFQDYENNIRELNRIEKSKKYGKIYRKE